MIATLGALLAISLVYAVGFALCCVSGRADGALRQREGDRS